MGEHEIKTVLKIKRTIKEYYCNLDNRQCRGMTSDRCLNEIQRILGMRWKPTKRKPKEEKKPTKKVWSWVEADQFLDNILKTLDEISTNPENLIKQTELEKPLIGIMPKIIHDRRRLIELAETIGRYSASLKKIRPEWIEEYHELLEKCDDKK